MGTKANPGKFDCYANAAPDEPIFVLLGRDRHAAEVVRYWVALRDGVEVVGYCCNVSDKKRAMLPEKLREALDCADAMYEYQNLQKIPKNIFKELESLRAFKNSVIKAFTSGDGTYRP